MLAWTIYISFAGALLARLSPSKGLARAVALLTALAGLGIGLVTLHSWAAGEFVTVTRVAWVPQLGLEYHLAADGISLTLVLLTGLAATAGILFSWNIEKRTQEFFAFFLVLIGGVYGVFLSFDLFLLFVFYEIAIIPKYFLIAIWGSAKAGATGDEAGSQREYAAMKLALYSFGGSALVLAGMVATWVAAGGRSMSFDVLATAHFSTPLQMALFPLVFVGFAILAGMWPFHTWAPTGHAAAPTAASMLLAGVVMKLGAYGCLRVAMMLFPAGLGPWGFHVLGLGSWREVFALLAVIGIVYGASVALVQRDFKFVIGYSSVSHMGFVLLGLMTLTQIGLDGAVLQMFSHGVIAGLLFAVVGRMVYDRTHTRDLNELGPMQLGHAIPFAAVTFILAGMASIGLPGFSGFIAEFQVLVGTWQSFSWMIVIAGIGILVGIAFTWRALTKAFYGEPTPGAIEHALPPITFPEKLGALLLLASTLAVGLYPRILTDLILPALNSPLFEGLRAGGVAMNPISYADLFRATLPEIVVAVTGLVLLALDLSVLRRADVGRRLGVGALIACIGSLLAIWMLMHGTGTTSLPDAMLVVTPLTRVVQIALLALTILTALLSTSTRITEHVGEYLALILFATVAMMFLVATQNLLLIFVALEFLSLSLYILTGFDKQSRQSAEAGLKYFLFGGMSAGFLLFGMSLLYGVSGSIQLPQIAAAISGPALDPLVLIAIVMVAIGFGFKVAAAPFHLWAPDAYQGAPTVSAGFIASSSKVASFFIFAQVVTVGLAMATGSGAYRGYAPGWVPVLCAIAALSMIVGNLAAIAQTSVRRLLAYSAIGHAGYMLLGLIAHSAMGKRALIYYVITYALASLGAFGVLGTLEAEGIDKISDLAGLNRRAPGLSFCLLIFVLSLAGIPPLSGFFAKFYIFSAAVDAEPHLGLLWLVLLAVAMSAVSLYYYLKVLKQVYVVEGAAEAGPLRVSLVTRVTIWVLAGLVVLLGCAPGLLLRWLGA